MSTRHSEDPEALSTTAGMSRDIINIPDNVLADGTRDYAEADRDDLQWLLSWASKELAGSRSRLCEKLATDWSTLFRICTGTYPASITSIMSRVRALKRQALEGGSTSFVSTTVTRKIHETLDYALAGDADGGKIVMISAPSRRGKTASIAEWCRNNNHGRSVYIDTPESGGMRALISEVAKACRIHRGRGTADMRDRVISSFNRRRILVVDEAARLIPHSGRAKVVELDFIRRLHDVQRCAIAFSVTPVFSHLLESGELRAFLEQLVGRISDPLVIPEKVFRSECTDICRHFAGGPPSAELVDLAQRIANEPGKLGVLFELLRQAEILSRKRSVQLDVSHLSAAYARRKQRTTWTET